MKKTFSAIFSKGVLKPLEPVEGLEENGTFKVTVDQPSPGTPPLADWKGNISDSDAAEMKRAIESEFEEVDPDEWK
jgi:predicted DNA-binding antitoxin AbrB/MazE fold protein